MGNHEFDQGYNDLVNRVMAPYNASTNPKGGANWQYIGANLRTRPTATRGSPPTWTKTMDGVKVGFVGAVTEHLPELVSPAASPTSRSPTSSTRSTRRPTSSRPMARTSWSCWSTRVRRGTNCARWTTTRRRTSAAIITGVNDNVDAIVSGHTHLEYDCYFTVPGWVTRAAGDQASGGLGRSVRHGAEPAHLRRQQGTGEVVGAAPGGAAAEGRHGGPFNYPVDPTTQAIVDAAVANAAVLGAQPLGQFGGPFFRGKLADGTTENRGTRVDAGQPGRRGAEVGHPRTPESGSAQIAFMNPGGLRQDMAGHRQRCVPADLTYQQAADVQPFANTLVNMDLTGAQIKTVLEQQWQPAGASRPFLKLGISKGFTYTFTTRQARRARGSPGCGSTARRSARPRRTR